MAIEASATSQRFGPAAAHPFSTTTPASYSAGRSSKGWTVSSSSARGTIPMRFTTPVGLSVREWASRMSSGTSLTTARIQTCRSSAKRFAVELMAKDRCPTTSRTSESSPSRKVMILNLTEMLPEFEEVRGGRGLQREHRLLRDPRAGTRKWPQLRGGEERM